MSIILGVLLSLLFRGIFCESITDYYENLIQYRTTAAQDYKIPESNSEFKEGTNSPDITDIGSYDFIIIGAGSAGSVLATRISEIDEWNILLLEAGNEENQFNKIPNMFMFLQFSEMNWGYTTTPQTNCCLGMKNKRCLVPRGKSIGGTSAINAAIYSRGNHKDYDKWVELGNPGWSYEEVLPYFKKSENSQINGDPSYHGKGGFWNVEYSLPSTALYNDFIKGHEELNRPIIDYNGKNELGAGKIQYNMKRGIKQSTGTAFLDNARKRKNLRVITKSLVIKININKNTKTAESVVFVNNNTKFRATAKKEILLSGGAINSPQLLMLSGIGPKKHLQDIDIDVIEDLPVGENLIEHPIFNSFIFRTNFSHPDIDVQEQIKDYLNGYGPLTIPGNFDGIGFVHTKAESPDVPITEYIFASTGPSTPSVLTRVNDYEETLLNQYLKKINPKTDINFLLLLLHQKSRGRVTLKSKNPIDFPNIDLNLFSESEDIDNFIKGIEFIFKLVETEAFRKLNATHLDIPICQEFQKYSRSFWECTLRHMAITAFHPSGTTAMGPNKTNSVVDTNLKVHGIKKLRVVDAGVIPSCISGHPAAPIVMVAEKIADVIKQEYSKRV